MSAERLEWIEPADEPRAVVLLENPETSVGMLLGPLFAMAAMSPQAKAAMRKRWAQEAAEREAAARAYRAEKPDSRAAQRRLRQLAKRKQP